MSKSKTKVVDRALLFTDIKSSSELWSKYGAEHVMSILDQHDVMIREFADKCKGTILKTSGDSYMISFHRWKSAFEFSLQFQNYSNAHPIMIDEKLQTFLQVRIGFCFGTVTKQFNLIQNHWLADYFGTTVNKASRMESKVSPIGGFAFCFHTNSKGIQPTTFEDLDSSIQYKIDEEDFKDDCSNDILRSQRIMNVRQQHCHSTSELKGVGEVKAFKVTLVNTNERKPSTPTTESSIERKPSTPSTERKVSTPKERKASSPTTERKASKKSSKKSSKKKPRRGGRKKKQVD